MSYSLIFPYGTLLLGFLVQMIFLWLPLNFKSWYDDHIAFLTYLGLQMGIAVLLSVFVLKTQKLGFQAIYFYLLAIFIFSWVRAIKLIPLEGTEIQKITPTFDAFPQVNFNELHHKQGEQMVRFSQKTKNPNEKLVQLRERLARQSNSNKKDNAQ